MNKDVAVLVEGVEKTFRLPHERHTTFKQKVLSLKSNRGFENQHVLKGVSFQIEKGEFFGIVGRNGSGKSTLLKIIAGVYAPDRGVVKVNGSLSPFIELGVGFNPQLTGRENVFLSGALLGFTRRQMDAMYEEIVSFAELHRFMDQKLKNYSSGMQVRLAFSIAIRAKGNILLLDEVLAVGDSAFQQKCLDYFAQLKQEKRTVILVTHSMTSVERFCDRALLLEKGKIKKLGESSQVAELYEELFIEDANKSLTKEVLPASPTKPTFAAVEATVKQQEKVVNTLKALHDFEIQLKIRSRTDVDSANVGINIRNDQDKVVFSTDTRRSIGELKLRRGKDARLDFIIQNRYTNGGYAIDVHLVNEGGGDAPKILFREKGIASFKVAGITAHAHSLFHPEFTIKTAKKER